MLKSKTTSFDNLNPAQRKAATLGSAAEGKPFSSGPLLVIAGAGTGKTDTLAHRAAHLVLNGIDPARILLLTFTRRAAAELVHRTQSIVSEVLAERGKLGDRSVTSRLVWAGTFHSVGARILRLSAKHLKLDPAFSVIDRSDAADLMELIRHEMKFSAKEKRFPRKDACLAVYSYRVNTRLSLQQTIQEQFPWCKDWEQDLAKLYREYVGRKQKNNVLDHDDLLLYWHLMMQNPALAQGLARNFDHVLVDEYQDLSALQGEIVHALKPDGAGVAVAGDDAQAIYSFRAAAADNILGFAERYKPKADVVVLSQNYRSTQQILNTANALTAEGARQHRKTLLTTRQSTAKPCYVSVEDAYGQAEYIVTKILATREIGGALRRHAILFRSPHHSDVLEVELAKRNIPFMKYGSSRFLEAVHVKDLLGVLRWVDNPRNSVAGFRVLKLLPGFGPSQAKEALEHLAAHDFSIASLGEFAAPQPNKMDWKRFCELMGKLADPQTPWAGQVRLVRDWYKPQLERIYDSAWIRLGDLEQLEHLAGPHATRERFLTELTLDPPALSSDQAGAAGKDEDYVVLSTLLAAKGQEWDFVYVLNVADGNFPSEFSTGRPEMMEEERRLLYVGITRARNELHLCAPLRMAVTPQAGEGDKAVHAARSRFVTDKMLETLEQSSYRSLRGFDNLGSDDGASIDVTAKLKEMW